LKKEILYQTGFVGLGCLGAVLVGIGVSNTNPATIISGIALVIGEIISSFKLQIFGENISSVKINQETIQKKVCGNCGYRVKEFDKVVDNKCPQCKHYDLDGDVLHYGL